MSLTAGLLSADARLRASIAEEQSEQMRTSGPGSSEATYEAARPRAAISMSKEHVHLRPRIRKHSATSPSTGSPRQTIAALPPNAVPPIHEPSVKMTRPC